MEGTSAAHDAVAAAQAAQRPPAPVALVVSPHAGGAGVGDPERLLAEAGIRVAQRLLVSDLDHGAPQGMAWRALGVVAAVVAGGDGSIGAVATQLAGSGLPLGILPMGTSNDTARALGVPLDLRAACAAIATGVPTAVDVGQALPAVTEPGALATYAGARTPPDAATQASRRGAYFAHALTLGFNVQFARLATDIARRKRWGALNYITATLEALTHYHAAHIRLRLNGVKRADGVVDDGEQVIEAQVAQLAVVNLPVFGGGLNLRLPGVRLHDGLLDFVLFEVPDSLAPQGLRALLESWEPLIHAGAAAERQATEAAHAPIALPGVRRYCARQAVIESANPMDMTLDGEVRANTPALVRVAPQPLMVLLPAKASAQLGSA